MSQLKVASVCDSFSPTLRSVKMKKSARVSALRVTYDGDDCGPQAGHFVMLAADSSYSYSTVLTGSCSHRCPCFNFSGAARVCLPALVVVALSRGLLNRFTVTSQPPQCSLRQGSTGVDDRDGSLSTNLSRTPVVMTITLLDLNEGSCLHTLTLS